MTGRQAQADSVLSLPDHVLILNLYFTQSLMALAAMVAGLLFGYRWDSFVLMLRPDPVQILLYGGGLAAFILLMDWLLTEALPEGLYDDGGINERIFSVLSFPHILVITIVIAVVEETLFRGVLQNRLGLIWASLIFSAVHFRYLRKAVLFSVTVGTSLLLGLSFLFTRNLLVPIFAHFCIDFVLGVSIRVKYRNL